MKTYTQEQLFDGVKAFQLRDAHGLPFDIIFDKIINDSKRMIDWLEFMMEAARCGWEKEKIKSEIEYGLRDAMVDREMTKEIMIRVNKWLKL